MFPHCQEGFFSHTFFCVNPTKILLSLSFRLVFSLFHSFLCFDLAEGGGKEVEVIKEIILETNPLLEAFGNAKTLRNNNSSRFGKYFEIQFTRSGQPMGGVITNYLLEKSRVVGQIQGERNFHIFYQLVTGASQEEREAFQLYGAENYYYLAQSGCDTVPGIDDVKEFADTRRAMEVCGVSPEYQYYILRTLAAILWLGNVTFSEDGNGKAQIQDMSLVEFTASLLDVEPFMLKAALTERIMQTTRGGRVSSTYNVPLNYDQACNARDAMAKATYSRMFDYLVGQINSVLNKGRSDNHIGVLDIFGFEIFDRNGFEQLCINYVNEKLQQIFIELTLKSEQEEYDNEGIAWTPIEYFNNKVVCSLLEDKRPPGVFAIMNDVAATSHSEFDDGKLLGKLHQIIQHQHYVVENEGFAIKHYAGTVSYAIEGMSERNVDTLFRDAIDLMQSSSNAFVSGLYPEKQSLDNRKRPTTSSTKIIKSAAELVKTLMACQPHYIRCLKPNEKKKAKDWNNDRCRHQIQYLGLLENVRVRRAGWCYRSVFEKFLRRYCVCTDGFHYYGEPQYQGDAMSTCVALLQQLNIDTAEYQAGRTKMFLRHPETLFALEELRERYYHKMASRIQRCYRSWKARKYFLELRAKSQDLFTGRKERTRMSLIRSFAGDYLNVRADFLLQAAIGEAAVDEGILFADNAYTVVHKTLRGQIRQPRKALINKSKLFIVGLKKVKGVVSEVLERTVSLSKIQSVSLSPYQDGWVVLHVPSEYDVVLELATKTELVSTIVDVNGNVPLTFVDQIVYTRKKQGKVGTLSFVVDDINGDDVGIFKKGTITVATGMPADSQLKKKGNQQIGAASNAFSNGKNMSSFSKQRNMMQSSNYNADNDTGFGGGGFGGGSSSGGFGQQPSQPKFGGGGGGGFGQQQPKFGGGGGGGGFGQPKSTPSFGGGGGGFGQQQTTTPSFGGGGGGGGFGQPKTTPSFGGPKSFGGPPPPVPQRKAQVPQVEALYEYQATSAEEISFNVGDVFELNNKDDGGWWEGTKDGKKGYFPGNYVKEL
eukprot:TRINITY_DN989_c1_g1_i3.p1 TRINITY_DN989_c1_g1~~TRINITY_DN989_c1_g1_i3.p1  ORF type:complete len:1045 (-),score=440.19 TRINITY_DN989_c1_g1_i3:1406-4540(-)